MSTRQADPVTLQPVAAILGALLPGAGYFALGERKRAVLVMASVLGLFFGGLLIGGVSVVDRKDNRWWFYAQAGVGPTAFAVDLLHSRVYKNPGSPGAVPAGRSLSRVYEVGSLYAALAGMLNLIAVIDVAWSTPKRRGLDARRPKGAL